MAWSMNVTVAIQVHRGRPRGQKLVRERLALGQPIFGRWLDQTTLKSPHTNHERVPVPPIPNHKPHIGTLHDTSTSKFWAQAFIGYLMHIRLYQAKRTLFKQGFGTLPNSLFVAAISPHIRFSVHDPKPLLQRKILPNFIIWLGAILTK